MTYTLVTANRNYSSWSLRPWVLMKALGIAFEDRVEPFLAPGNPQFLSFSPTAKVPVLINGNRTVHDSLAIALYLAERHDGVWPTDDDARAWAMSAVAEMHSGFGALRNDCTMNVGVRVRPKPMSDALKADVARIAALFAEGLDCFGGPWLAGRAFTAADAFFAPVAYRIRTYGLDVGVGQSWVDHCLAHPAMRQWEAEALTESWREQAHEDELRDCGDVIADYRSA
ncbi:glutathione S-transferase family protein [Sphingomonas sp. SUN039]|uniref:glutathione S-transferase family protein n=1 Tax=Sphingomonas sp. SUN039 TaxID=2937787 RepID=UPI002164AC83|nr:glutathione S-transferase family protein [Sphingomonas sp. SUN039]UVO54189.1 glutathione S-transferase family protein [Sphingomonas sp. SUN039]